jgi:hypothetical protein
VQSALSEASVALARRPPQPPEADKPVKNALHAAQQRAASACVAAQAVGTSIEGVSRPAIALHRALQSSAHAMSHGTAIDAAEERAAHAQHLAGEEGYGTWGWDSW